MLGDYGDTSYEDVQYGQLSDASAHEAFDALWARGMALSVEVLAAHTWLGAHTSVSFSNAITQKMAAIESAPMMYGQVWERTNDLQDFVEECEDFFKKLDEESIDLYRASRGEI